MAHKCPECAMTCHCNGDVDDMVFDYDVYCTCCENDSERAIAVDESKPVYTYILFEDGKSDNPEFELRANNIMDAASLASRDYGSEYFVRLK